MQCRRDMSYQEVTEHTSKKIVFYVLNLERQNREWRSEICYRITEGRNHNKGKNTEMASTCEDNGRWTKCTFKWRCCVTQGDAGELVWGTGNVLTKHTESQLRLVVRKVIQRYKIHCNSPYAGSKWSYMTNQDNTASHLRLVIASGVCKINDKTEFRSFFFQRAD